MHKLTPRDVPAQRTARLSFLIEKNLRGLLQVLRTIEQHDEPTSLPNIGSVVRYYRSFLDGLNLCHIDYNQSSEVEDMLVSRVAVLGLVRRLIDESETSVELSHGGIVWVRLDRADSSGIRDCFMESSVSRELQMLADRTTQVIVGQIGELSQLSIREVA
jgi:hypothetical protein